VTPTSFGLGYAKSRIDGDILTAFGVDYMCGLVLFRRFATAFGYWSDELGQVREAYPDGRYYAIGGGDEAFRVALMPSGNATRLLVVEGPFDALAVVQAVGLHGLEAMWLWVAALCGGK